MTPPTAPPTCCDLHIVEQVPYKCEIQKDWVPFPPIDFKVKGKKGMKLTDAMNLHFDGPDGRDDPMFTQEGIGNSILFRVQVRGFYGGNSVVTQSPCFISLSDGPRAANRQQYVQLITLFCSWIK